jgi:hypothetical protein
LQEIYENSSSVVPIIIKEKIFKYFGSLTDFKFLFEMSLKAKTIEFYKEANFKLFSKLTKEEKSYVNKKSVTSSLRIRMDCPLLLSDLIMLSKIFNNIKTLFINPMITIDTSEKLYLPKL